MDLLLLLGSPADVTTVWEVTPERRLPAPIMDCNRMVCYDGPCPEAGDLRVDARVDVPGADPTDPELATRIRSARLHDCAAIAASRGPTAGRVVWKPGQDAPRGAIGRCVDARARALLDTPVATHGLVLTWTPCE